MVKVTILESLKDEILKKFKEESKIIFRQMYSLGDIENSGNYVTSCPEFSYGQFGKTSNAINQIVHNPNKGKSLGHVVGIAIKELKYKNFRFYFITDGYKLKIMDQEKLVDLLMRFVRMSDKKHQQETISEIKKILINFGSKGFDE